MLTSARRHHVPEITLPVQLDQYVSIALFVLGAYLLALYVGLVVWTFRDVHARTRDVLGQIMATLLVAVFTLPGLLVYMLLRPHETLAQRYERDLTEEAILQDLEDQRICPKCRRRVEPDYLVCPACHHQLRVQCDACGRLLQPDWAICPYCGAERAPEEPDEEPTIEPAAMVDWGPEGASEPEE
jgi:RNA polymerase subunit RPABC4/transcription elongation factor Spt4